MAELEARKSSDLTVNLAEGHGDELNCVRFPDTEACRKEINPQLIDAIGALFRESLPASAHVDSAKANDELVKDLNFSARNSPEAQQMLREGKLGELIKKLAEQVGDNDSPLAAVLRASVGKPIREILLNIVEQGYVLLPYPPRHEEHLMIPISGRIDDAGARRAVDRLFGSDPSGVKDEVLAVEDKSFPTLGGFIKQSGLSLIDRGNIPDYLEKIAGVLPDSDIWKGITPADVERALVANELSHARLYREVVYGRVSHTDLSSFVIPRASRSPSGMEVNEFLSDAGSIGVTPLEIPRILVNACRSLDKGAEGRIFSKGLDEADKFGQNYSYTNNFALEQLRKQLVIIAPELGDQFETVLRDLHGALQRRNAELRKIDSELDTAKRDELTDMGAESAKVRFLQDRNRTVEQFDDYMDDQLRPFLARLSESQLASIQSAYLEHGQVLLSYMRSGELPPKE